METTDINMDKPNDSTNFWSELNRIMKNINKDNPSRLVYSYESRVITDYYLWEILKQLRKLNGLEEVEKSTDESLKEEKTLLNERLEVINKSLNKNK